MRKCREVPLTILAAAALLAVGCHDEQERRDCVDANNRIVPDDRCRADSPGTNHYLYSGRSGGRVGDVVVGGSTVSGVSRGGFGGHGGEGGAGGEGGGE